jgi:hypothetical protein
MLKRPSVDSWPPAYLTPVDQESIDEVMVSLPLSSLRLLALSVRMESQVKPVKP